MATTSRRGCDFAWGVTPGRERELARALKHAGFHFVVRYLGRDPSKNITAAEVHAYRAEKLGIVTVYEDAATWMLGGASAGHDAARLARDQLRAAGAPAHAPVYFADDFPVTAEQLATVDACLDATAFVLTESENGIYGPFAAVSKAQHCRYRWQTVAWSGGAWAPDDNIRQYAVSGTTLGVQWDVDTSAGADFGQWLWPGQDPDPVAKPKQHRARKAAHKTKVTVAKAKHAVKKTVTREPVVTAGGLVGVLGTAVAYGLQHIGVHLTPTQAAAVLTAVTGLGSVFAAFRTRPVAVSAVAGALATIATASVTFGLHLPAWWVGAQMPVASLIVALLVRVHVSPAAPKVAPSASATLQPAAVAKSLPKLVQRIELDAGDFHQVLDDMVAHASAVAAEIEAKIPGVATKPPIAPAVPAAAAAAAPVPVPGQVASATG